MEWQTETPAVSVGAMLVIQNDIPEDLGYEITKAIYDNASKLATCKREIDQS